MIRIQRLSALKQLGRSEDNQELLPFRLGTLLSHLPAHSGADSGAHNGAHNSVVERLTVRRSGKTEGKGNWETRVRQ